MVTLNPAGSADEWCINTWHYASRDATPPLTAASDFKDALDAFYQAVDANITQEFSGMVPTLKIYNLIEPKPRVPIAEYTLTALTTGSQRAPREISCVVSYRAEYVSGVSPRRRRGRIYLGPLTQQVFDTASGLFTSGTVSTISTAADAFVTASDSATTWAWVVYSPTTDISGTGEAGMYEVVAGWVDNNPDIQRRRGAAGGTRTHYAP